MDTPIPRPVFRSPLRMRLGAVYFSLRRHLLWRTRRLSFAGRTTGALPYTAAAHATPLLRRLKDVDMALQINKITNLKLAAARLDGLTLRPGEVFSYWRAIGKPSRRKGYLLGMILVNGGFTAGTGGGLCQMSNLVYWMSLHTPLTVLERHRHNYDVFPDADRTQPFGSGATCYYNYGDLMLRNDTDLTFRLHVEVTAQSLAGQWQADNPLPCRYEVYESEPLMRPEYWGGYTRHNKLRRKIFDPDGALRADELIA
ncbi:MAG: VanW family protein, partial [Firmicutes bacterium]|nr:VanW family protein [Bacillota bacterium]